jgi:hypothetical protein
MTENWRPIIGYESLYEVSDQGRVRSLDRPRRNGVRSYKGRILKHGFSKGYPRVNLYDLTGAVRFACIHQVMAEAFLGPCPAGQQVRHFDDNRLNCTLGNLVYGTHADNVADRIKNGLQPRGETHGQALLTADDVRMIRSLVGSVSQKELARRYGVDPSSVSNIVRRRYWRHL